MPEVLEVGGGERLSWSLTSAMPGTSLDELCTWPAPAGLRGLAREAAGLLRALHSWPVPAELAVIPRRPVSGPGPLRRAVAELVLLPPSSALSLIPAASKLPFVDHGVLGAGRRRACGTSAAWQATATCCCTETSTSATSWSTAARSAR